MRNKCKPVIVLPIGIGCIWLIHIIKEFVWISSFTVSLRSLSTFSGSSQSNIEFIGYTPSKVEEYVIDKSSGLLRYNGSSLTTMAKGCDIWKEESASAVYTSLQQYRAELKDYNMRLQNFKGSPVKDLRLHLNEENGTSSHIICNELELHTDGLAAIFPSGALSMMDGNGLIEPLLPPLRHPEFCFNRTYLMDLGYLVQDFASMCRKLKRHSRTVFIDMGAALDFHSKAGIQSPAIYITHMYHHFGFHFDHIYAYEMRKKDPEVVYGQIPSDLKAAYHWYNVGVSSDQQSDRNPFKLLLENFNEDDFVVVKLDIDTSAIELPLAESLLNNKELAKLVDCFYFEHHVFLYELSGSWGQSMEGSLEDSLNLFTQLRKAGIAAHYWP